MISPWYTCDGRRKSGTGELENTSVEEYTKNIAIHLFEYSWLVEIYFYTGDGKASMLVCVRSTY